MRALRWALAIATAMSAPGTVTGHNELPAPTVLFAPDMQAALASTYGEAEGSTLKRTIGERVSAALKGDRCKGIAQVEITVLDARPTHPTDKQLEDNAALDRLRSHYAGGAAFSVRLLDASGRELSTLRYDWYAQDPHHGSMAAEPWGDVRLASEGLGSQLARACRKVASAPPPTP